jgi:hypothetical protein
MQYLANGIQNNQVSNNDSFSLVENCIIFIQYSQSNPYRLLTTVLAVKEHDILQMP